MTVNWPYRVVRQFAKPFVFLAGRPATERAADARWFRFSGLLLFFKLAMWDDDGVVSDRTHACYNRTAHQHTASDVRLAISPMTSERMDCSRSCHDLTTVWYAARNQVLLASSDRDALSINQQCMAALHNQHVLIKFMDMLC